MKSVELSRRALLCLALSAFFALKLAVNAGADQGAVVSDHELATAAGTEMLKAGGNAVDAAVATAFSLAVAQPSASGLGGGGFMLVYLAKEKKIHLLDFRETAPKKAQRSMYVKGGKVVPELSRTGALSVAVPGEVAGLAMAQRKFGKLPLAKVVKPAIRLARSGIPLDAHLKQILADHLSEVKKSPSLSKLFLKDDGTIPLDQDLVKQPDLARTIEAIGIQGEEVFYRGWIAKLIADQLQAQGGILSEEDLRNYRVVWREPILGHYRDSLFISASPPSSGGVTILQILKSLEAYDLTKLSHNSATYLHLLAEMMKRAFSDRTTMLGDPDFAKIPVDLLLSKDHAEFARLKFSSVKVQPHKSYPIRPLTDGGTSHLNSVDSEGNAVACTLSINTSFGSKMLVEGAGFLLNNEMDDFSIHPGTPNTFGLVGSDANAIEPRKRPLSSMAPTLLMKNNRPYLLLGASGGPRIISSVLQTILNVVDFKMDLRRAIEAPRIHHQWVPNVLQVEKSVPITEVRSLERRGHEVQERQALGAVQAIVIQRGKATTESDPRRAQRPTDADGRPKPAD